jgi:hypothetical protein
LSSSAAPYLSVVATARNDDHGGNPLYRTQLFINGLVEQSDRFELPTELVLVEWNPPQDRPRLSEVLEWPRGQGYCTVRIVEVPAELHARLEHSDRLPLFQMIAKNVGIRRARGDFVVATNIDILFSDGLMRYLAGRKLRDGHVYRTDRFDVPAEIDPAWPIDEQLAFCDRAAIRVNRREGTLDLRSGTFYRVYPDISPLVWLRNSLWGWRLLNSRAGRLAGLRRLLLAPVVPHVGFFGRVADVRRSGAMGARMWLFGIRLFVFRLYAFAYWIVAGFNQPRLVPRRIGNLLRGSGQEAGGATGAPATDREPGGRRMGMFWLPLVKGLSRAAKRQWVATGRAQSDELVRVRLHTNASGDFTLMSKLDWLKSGGYAEFEMYSMHIDGLLLYVAHYSGISERFLPFPVYHVEHGGGFRPEAKGDQALDATLTKRAIPQISNEQLMGYIRTMYHERSPIRHNREDWGFATVVLVEAEPQEVATLVGVTPDRGDE